MRGEEKRKRKKVGEERHREVEPLEVLAGKKRDEKRSRERRKTRIRGW